MLLGHFLIPRQPLAAGSDQLLPVLRIRREEVREGQGPRPPLGRGRMPHPVAMPAAAAAAVLQLRRLLPCCCWWLQPRPSSSGVPSTRARTAAPPVVVRRLWPPTVAIRVRLRGGRRQSSTLPRGWRCWCVCLYPRPCLRLFLCHVLFALSLSRSVSRPGLSVSLSLPLSFSAPLFLGPSLLSLSFPRSHTIILSDPIWYARACPQAMLRGTTPATTKGDANRNVHNVISADGS